MKISSRAAICLRPALKASRIRDQTRCHSFARLEEDSPQTPVAFEYETDYATISHAKLRELAFIPEKPLLMKARASFLRSEMAMPAFKKWFDFPIPTHETGFLRFHSKKSKPGKVMSAYLKSFASTTMLPFELAYPQTHRLYGEVVHQFIESLRQEDGLDSATKRVTTDPNFDNRASPATCAGLADLLQAQLPPISEMDNPERMGRPKDYKLQKTLHFTAPLALLDAAVKFNFKRPDTGIRNLYVAQAPLNDLPKELQDDLPVPKIVKKAGKGDIYDSSIWLGLEPTYTPLHRDPNPNLFIQLCGNKIVRLLPPASGERVYREVQSRLGTHLRVNSRLRGTEMMDGPERYLMHNAIWNQVADDQELPRREMQEGMLQPGDSLFIPKGWWHSVKSEDDAGRLNASVNWWFR